MKIIAISGRSSIGKSKTIVNIAKKLYQKLKTSEDSHVSFPLFDGNSSENEVICYIYDKKHNINIGIVSYGDPNGYLQEGIEKISKEKKIDLLICACRTWGGTINYLKSLSKEIIIIKKMFVENVDNISSDILHSMNNSISDWIVENYYYIYQNL